ncbi:MAG: acyl-phosphate glycerol 3-phosphate acyltransferase [Bacteroidetes bacterium]|nr:acyl-phosphate glycerol 3-phosphate acyltransferase [Bacteroidota bacterium]
MLALSVLHLLAGYLIGSIPTAFLVVKRTAGVDIRQSGSGYVGGFNAFTVTRSKSIGYLVGVLDGVKGLVAVFVAGLTGEMVSLQMLALFGAVLGHNYPVWLRFKGGRGLATACGGLLLIGVSYPAIWCTLWIVIYLVRKDILFANVLSLVLAPMILFLLPEMFARQLMTSSMQPLPYTKYLAVLSLVLLVSHADAVKSILKPNTQ